MTDTWTPEAARERLKIGLEYDPEGLISYSVDLARALDWITKLEALLAERERAVAEQGAWGLALETECSRLRDRIVTLEAQCVSLRMEGRMRPLPYLLDESDENEGE